MKKKKCLCLFHILSQTETNAKFFRLEIHDCSLNRYHLCYVLGTSSSPPLFSFIPSLSLRLHFTSLVPLPLPCLMCRECAPVGCLRSPLPREHFFYFKASLLINTQTKSSRKQHLAFKTSHSFLPCPDPLLRALFFLQLTPTSFPNIPSFFSIICAQICRSPQPG